MFMLMLMLMIILMLKTIKKSTKHRSKIGPKSFQNRSKIKIRNEVGSGSDFEPILGPTWSHLASKIGPCWSHVGHYLGHFWLLLWNLNLRWLWKRFCVCFWLIFDLPRSPKTSAPSFWILLHLRLDRSWNRSWTNFWLDFGLQNRSKIGPKSRMVLEIIVVFEGLQDPLKIDFSANMAATCPQLGTQHAPKLGPKWCRNRSRRPMGPHGPPWSPSEPSSDRFWVDFW